MKVLFLIQSTWINVFLNQDEIKKSKHDTGLRVVTIFYGAMSRLFMKKVGREKLKKETQRKRNFTQTLFMLKVSLWFYQKIMIKLSTFV